VLAAMLPGIARLNNAAEQDCLDEWDHPQNPELLYT